MSDHGNREIVIGVGIRNLLPDLDLTEDEVIAALRSGSDERGPGDRRYIESVTETGKILQAECVVDSRTWYVVWVHEK